MEILREFKAINKGDAGLAGGKGASLGEMTQAGIPVPPGFVLLSGAFERFIEETDLNVEIDTVLHSVNHKEMHTVDGASEKIQALILEAEMPKDIEQEIKKNFKKLGAQFVAVRSSATAEDSSSAAWAGQLDSFLNTTEKTLIENVQKCWASLFTPRAIFYRFEKDLHKTKISVAVVVQKMVESEISGIAFSVHPVTEDRNQLIIEAGLGLGEAIVSGQITPDSYVVEKKPRRIIDANVSAQDRGIFKKIGGGNEWRDISPVEGEKQKLNEKQILELSELILHIEKHYGFPCDIEWAFEGGKFYITQSRPITTLSNKVEVVDDEVWVNNASVDKCGYQLGSPVMGFGIPYGVGALMGKKNNQYLTKRFYYFQGVDMKGMFYSEIELNSFANEILDLIYGKPELIKKNHRYSYKLNDVYFSYAKRFVKRDFSGMSNKELAKMYVRLSLTQEKAHAHSLGTTWFVDSTGGLFADRLLEETRKIITDKKSNLNPAEVFTTLTTPEKNSFAIQEELESLKVLEVIFRNKKSRAIFEKLSKYDSIPIELPLKVRNAILAHYSKWKWTPFGYLGPTYGVDYYLSVWAGLVSEKTDFKLEIKKILGRVKQIKKEKASLIKSLKISSKARQVYDIAADITFLKGYRKDCSYMGFYAFSKMVPEIAKRLRISNAEVHLLTYKEIEKFLLSRSKIDSEELARRKTNAVLLIKDGEVVVISGDEAERFVKEKNIRKEEMVLDATLYKGNCACSGKARGLVKIINQPEDMSKMGQGDIMVSHTTFPSLVPAMKKASAIVTEDGGITCHAAIVARELKTPCVTGIKVITKVVKDGDEIEVDADNGIVRIIKK